MKLSLISVYETIANRANRFADILRRTSFRFVEATCSALLPIRKIGKMKRRFSDAGGVDYLELLKQLRNPAPGSQSARVTRLRQSARITTVEGARTGFFSPELDRLFLAVRRKGAQAAQVRVFAPAQ
jgi:hypothetical protein